MGCRGIRAGVLATATLTAFFTGAAPAGAQTYTTSRFIVDAPTAGLVPTGSFETSSAVFPGGGLEVRLDIGLADWLSFGGGYGGSQIIGDGDPQWNPDPGFFVKARILEEDFVYPALAIGIDTQGSGWYSKDLGRYQYMSRGLYAVASKNYEWFGDLSVHGGLSRTLEGSGHNKTPTLFAGFDKSLGGSLGAALEYDVALNDRKSDGSFGKGRGYLNAAIRWNLAPEMQFRFTVRDMLRNSEPIDPSLSDVVVDEGWGREISFSYLESF